MKQLGPLRLALVFAGCFLGAGYVSGQEIRQFFGTYGLGGYFGILLAILLLFAFGILILRLTQMTGEKELDRVVIPWKTPVLHWAVGILEVVFLFGVVAIMGAGVGALGNQLFKISPLIASAVFCLIVLLIAMSGLKGVVSAFSVSVPVLVICTVLFSIISVMQKDFTEVEWHVNSGDSILLHNWVLGAVTFACYNVFGAIGILIPLADYVGTKRSMSGGLALGSLGLLLIALSVMVSLSLYPKAAETELPMIDIALQLGAPFAYLYALLLVFAMFGTALSCLVAMADYLSKKIRFFECRCRLSLTGMMLLAFLSSLFGFGDLIGLLYPLFGYGSAIFLVFMVIYYRQMRRKSEEKKIL